MTTTETLRRAVEVDTELGRIHTALYEAYSNLERNKLSLANHADIRPVYVTRNRREVTQTAEELVEIIQTKVASGTVARYNVEAAEKTIAKRNEIVAEIKELKAEQAPLDAEFAAAPWSRFFLVTSSAGGHIHSSMHCSSCNFRTGFSWLPTLSGLSEKDAVAAHGAILCTVCYPSAPVEWTMGIVKDEKPKCSGSGRYATNWQRRYDNCPDCGKSVSVTSGGKLRAHA